MRTHLDEERINMAADMAGAARGGGGGGGKGATQSTSWKDRAEKLDQMNDKLKAAGKRAAANADHTAQLLVGTAETQTTVVATSLISGSLSGGWRTGFRVVRGVGAAALVLKGLHNALANGRGQHEFALANGAIAAEASEAAFAAGQKLREKWKAKKDDGYADPAAPPPVVQQAAPPPVVQAAPPQIEVTPATRGWNEVGDAREILPADLPRFIQQARARASA